LIGSRSESQAATIDVVSARRVRCLPARNHFRRASFQPHLDHQSIQQLVIQIQCVGDLVDLAENRLGVRGGVES